VSLPVRNIPTKPNAVPKKKATPVAVKASARAAVRPASLTT